MSLPLEIVVTGDTNDAKSALTDLQTQVGATVVSINKAGNSFSDLTAQLTRFKTAASGTLNPELLTVYNTKITELETQLKSMALAEQKAGSEAQSAAIKYEEMSVAVNNTSAGAKRFQSAIERATDPTSIAAREVNNLSRRMINLASSFVIGGGLVALVEGLIAFAQEAINASDNSNALAKATQSLNLALATASGSVAGEIVELKSLVSIAKDTSLSYDARMQAIQALNKEYPNLHGNISLETINTKKVTDAINEEIGAIKRRSQAKALEKLIDEKSVELENLKANGPLSGFDKFLEKASNAVGAPGLVSNVDYATEKYQQDLKDTNAQIDLFSKKLNELNVESAKAGNLVPPPKPLTSGQEYENALKRLQQYYEAVQLAAAKSYDANIADAKNNSIVVADILLTAEINYLEAKLALDKKYNKSTLADFEALSKAKREIDQNDIEFSKGILKDEVYQQIKDIANTKLPASEDPAKLQVAKIDPKSADSVAHLTEALQAYSDKLNEVDAQSQTYALFLNKELGPAFQQLFTSIIDGSGNAFSQFAKALEQIIVQLAATLLKAVALAAVITLIFPGAAGGKSFGDLFNSILGKGGIPGFAGGVKNFGGGLAVVGENGPELVSLPRGSNVIPNNQISQGQITPQIFIASSIVRGADLVTVYNRQIGVNSRNG